MPGLFIKKLSIENYKCFGSESIDLNVPDGNPGSGLNILIGENGNGKTSVLEAANYLTQSSYSVENMLNIHDFNDHVKKIVIKGECDDFDAAMPDSYHGCSFECNGFEMSAESRKRKESGKLLSAAFNASVRFTSKTGTYKDTKGNDTGKDIRGDALLFRNGGIVNGEINVFLFDKNRSRQISTGTYKTTFERICEDFNWRFLKELDDTTAEEIVQKIGQEVFKTAIDKAAKGAGGKLAQQMCEFLESDDFKNLKIDLMDLLHPFSQAFFSVRCDDELKQIRSKSLGSGVEMILTLLLLRSISGESSGSLIYLIDEPELHLHPKAQFKLVELLLEESKDKQILLSTHSPYIFKNALNGDSRMIIFKRDAANKIVVEYPTVAGWGKLPWSPSWGEINYHAFDLATVEFHHELFGHLQEKNGINTITGMDAFFVGLGLPQAKSWVRLVGSTPQPAQNVTLPYYVRNSIHHPENPHNAKYTDQELRDSIAAMLPHA
ncbi:MAG: AAA family ATPase [Acidobacteria bacterium]|nr:AAA family ATPase [Acidobacteriota bacterium]